MAESMIAFATVHVSLSINIHISFLFEILAGVSGCPIVAVQMDLCQSSCNIIPPLSL